MSLLTTLRYETTTTGASFVRRHNSNNHDRHSDDGGALPPDTMTAANDMSVLAGQPLTLECDTPDAGYPPANQWRWFYNQRPLSQHPLEGVTTWSTPNGYYKTASGGLTTTAPTATTTTTTGQLRNSSEANCSNKYLHIDSVKLLHRANYSCQAVNALGTGPSAGGSAPAEEAEGGWWSVGEQQRRFSLEPLAAPAIVQALPLTSGCLLNETHYELVCRVQCQPMCRITWLRNNRPIITDQSYKNNVGASLLSTSDPIIRYETKTMFINEQINDNIFASVQSTLKFKIRQPTTTATTTTTATASQQQHQASSNNKRTIASSGNIIGALDRIRDEANYTCESSPNSVGSGVATSSLFQIYYPPENVSIRPHRLDLVEGSEWGPKLLCQAQALPKAHYQWRFRPDVPVASHSKQTTTTTTNIPEEGLLLSTMTTTSSPSPPPPLKATGARQEVMDLSQKKVTRGQSGHYTCVARNQFGWQQTEAHVNVLCEYYCSKNPVKI